MRAAVQDARAKLTHNAPESRSQGFYPAQNTVLEVIQMTPPFVDAGPGEVLARVAHAYVKMRYRGGGYEHVTPALTVYAIARGVPDGLVKLHVALGALAHHLSGGGMSAKEWLRHAIMRSRYGMNFRSSVFFDYKVGRSDPRVTNRGVTGADNQ